MSNMSNMSKSDSRRITLIARGPASPSRDWDTSRQAASRLIFAEALTVLRHALHGGMAELNEDVQRVIIDQSNTASQYLDLLASLPAEFAGDALMIRHDDSAFLSATGRGGDRVLYALSPSDLRFYLEMAGLVVEQHESHSNRKTA